MSDVVDADELLRRIRRGRDVAAEEERVWRERAQSLTATDPDRAREAAERARTYEVVGTVLTEIITPGAITVPEPGAGGPMGPGVRRVT
ncbi:hypothetical protein [Streptomyces sp. SID4985]|uniref:hypothetical protein n=1 Tax=unclassified Streptomyces TaxID=2593676 RepID=UPI001367D43F|nr:hypothetical protein [Streptomyces sp. SID4985]MYQ47635.1 hypothetical protein [Streptomyces sp. SID4985]